MLLDRRNFLSVAALSASGAVFAESKAGTKEPLKGTAVKTRTRLIHPKNQYLHFPVKTDAPLRRVNLLVDGKSVREFGIELADGAPDWWAFIDLLPFNGAPIIIAVSDLPDSSNALESIHQSDQIEGSETLYREERRPQFHFSSRRGWVNDPHLVFYDGEYHLYYQHNPYGWKWGNGHWGHAVSSDLVHWRELPIALYPDAGHIMQSGSIVVDWNNTAGFQTGSEKTLVATYTRGSLAIANGRLIDAGMAANASPTKVNFTQDVAYSNDRGRTWTKYEGNPVIGSIVGRNHDPRVFWYAPAKKWVMVLYMGGHEFTLFSSGDLKRWEKMSDIALPGDQDCNDLFEIALDGNPSDTRWVFYGSRGLYLIGRFDGKTFTADSGPHAMQHGGGFYWYGPQSFSDIPASDGRRILISWAYSESAHQGMPFNGNMGIPVELTLRSTTSGPRVFLNPVHELAALRTKRHSVAPQILSSERNPLADFKVDLFELTTEIAPGKATKIVFNLRGVSVVYDAEYRRLLCGSNSAPLEMEHGKIRLRILVDRTSIEIFGNDGRLCMPMAMIVPPDDTSVAVLANGENAQINSLEIFELKSAWDNQPERFRSDEGWPAPEIPATERVG